MATEIKITKKDNYNTLRELVSQAHDLSNEDQDRLLSFIDHEVELIDQRAEKSKKYQQEHKAETDIMTDMIVDVLKESTAALSVSDIVAKIVDSTPQKVVYRLGKLFKDGRIVKNTQNVKVDGSSARKVTFYSVI